MARYFLRSDLTYRDDEEVRYYFKVPHKFSTSLLKYQAGQRPALFEAATKIAMKEEKNNKVVGYPSSHSDKNIRARPRNIPERDF